MADWGRFCHFLDRRHDVTVTLAMAVIRVASRNKADPFCIRARWRWWRGCDRGIRRNSNSELYRAICARFIPKANEEIYPDMSLKACVTSVLGTSSWYSGIPGQANRLLDLIGKLSQEAALSQLTIWGSRDLGSGFSLVGIKNNLEPIASEYWSTHVIDKLRFLENEEARSIGTLYETNDAFIDLHVKGRIEKLRQTVGIT